MISFSIMWLINMESLRHPCGECAGLPVHEQCVQTLVVDVRPMDSSLQGCGTSPHPREAVLNPKVCLLELVTTFLLTFVGGWRDQT